VHFRFCGASGEVVDEGEGTVAVQGRTVTVSPQLGQPLRIAQEQIAEVSEPVPYTLRIGLSDGSRVELSQLGPLRSQLLSQIGDIRVSGARGSLVTIGFGERQRFHGWVDGDEAEISLYDDGLVAVPSGGLPVQVPYAVVEDVTTDPSGYRIGIAMGDAGSVTVQRLAQMTSQFLTLLRQRVTAARGRTGAFLQAILPGLGALALRQLASDLRDGLAAPRSLLDAVDPSVWATLVGRAVLAERAGAAGVVQGLGECGLGFHQTRSVEVQAQGTFQTSEAAPVQSSGPGRGAGAFDAGPMERGMEGMLLGQMMGVPPPGGGGGGGPLLAPLGGAGGGTAASGAAMGMAAGMNVGGMGVMGGMGLGFGSPFGAMGGLLAMRLLRGDRSWAAGGEQQARGMYSPPAVSGGSPAGEEQGLIPAHTAFGRLGLGGDHPTVVAFLLARTAQGALVYEPLNIGDHATYVFRDPDLSLRQLNLALMLIGFRVQLLAGDVTALDSRYAEAVRRLPHLARLATAYRGRAIHGDGWEAQLRPLLS
jgi:hypothetical protein